jgi:exopolyphosphatase/guanosine-5'-triphosphate,3'-diphosphate pyrophosphatase
MRLGVLDIGSNSAQLQVVDVRPGAPPLPAHCLKEPTLLGEEIEPDGSVSQAGIDRVVKAVASAVSAASRHGVDQLYPFATSAVRDATNREEIVGRIQAEVGLRPQFLSGEHEARLTYLAAHRWYGWSVGRLLLFDIGGGSMEIALGRDADPELALSLPLGAGRLTRAFLEHDPPRRAEIKALRDHVRDTLGEVVNRLRWESVPRKVVATSKTFKQLARLAGAPPQREGPFVPRSLTIEDVRRWIPRLAKMSAAQRARLRGVSQPRARQILAGAVVAHAAMSALGVERLQVCPWALREGIMLRHLEAMADNAVPLPLQPLVRMPEGADATVTPLHNQPQG